MAVELVIFKRLAIFEFQDRNSPVVEECGWLLASGSRIWSNNIGSWELGTGAGSYGHQFWMAVPEVSTACNGIR